MERQELVDAIMRMIDEVENPRVLKMLYYYLVYLVDHQDKY